MALDGVFKMKNATPADINTVVMQIIDKEKQYFPRPQVGHKVPIEPERYRREGVTPNPAFGASRATGSIDLTGAIKNKRARRRSCRC